MPEYDENTLTKEEANALEEILDNHFSVYGSMKSGLSLPLRGIISDDFFKTSAGSSGSSEAYEEFLNEMEMEGYTEDEIEDYISDYLDQSVSDDAPHWRSTNPFGFEILKIKGFFSKQYQRALVHEGFANLDGEMVGGEYQEPDFYIEVFDPFTKPWFETMILCEIGQLELSLKMADEGSASSPWMQKIALSSAGKIGRLVEQYRWRFSFGDDTLRGRKTLASSKLGGELRSASKSETTKQILAEIERRVAAGHTVGNSARLVYNTGRGSSAEANRKLYFRYKQKRGNK